MPHHDHSALGGSSETGCQISVYPLRQEELHDAIEDAVEAVMAEGLEPQVGRLSTFFQGDEDAVFRALRNAFKASRERGDTVLVATLSTAVPSGQRVREIQEDVESRQ